jgi:hypothetical protein
MVLRRLFSGWLIAMAALARSMALALERAAADRPEPAAGSAAGPVMTALEERYPGAPAHWLAHLAERTSQLAQAGQVPLSLTSDATAWPPFRPPTPPEPSPPTLAEVEPNDRPGPSERADASARPSPRPDLVPSLAALQGRSSEVWRRPEAGQRWRPRPVFAPPAAVPTPRPDATHAGVTPREGPASQPASRFVALEQSPDAAAPVDPADAAARPVPTPTPTDPPVRPPLPALQTLAPAPAAASSASTSPEPVEDHAASTRQVDTGDVASSGKRPGFVASPPLAVSPRQATSFTGSAEEGATPPPASAADAARPKRSVSWSPPARSVRRRPIFRTPAARADQSLEAILPSRSPPMPGAPTAIVPPAATQPPAAAPGPAAVARSIPVRAPMFAAHGVQARADSTPVSRPAAEGARVSAFGREEATTPPPRPEMKTYRPPSPAIAAPRPIQPPTDDRWPSFPPAVFAPPQAAGVPAPRLHQLARDQEEGRWSV